MMTHTLWSSIEQQQKTMLQTKYLFYLKKKWAKRLNV